MSTKKQTDTTNTTTFDPASMNAFHSMTNQMTGYTNQWLGPNGNADPSKTPGFNLNYQSLLNNANLMGGRNIRNMTMNALSTGMNPNSAAFNAQLQRAGRATSSLQSNAFLNAYQNSQQQQNFAAQMAAAYRPLQTGGKTSSTETTSGAGTWAPQLAGAAIQGGMAFATGGASLAAKGLMSATKAGMSAGSSGAGLGWGGSSFNGTNPTWR